MTYSIAGKCHKTGQVGAAITTSSIAVTSRCVWVKAGVGVVLSQNVTDPALGALGLKLLEDGYSSDWVVNTLKKAKKHAQWRQIAVLDMDGSSAYFQGAKSLGIHAAAQGENCVAAGNLLSGQHIPKTMIESFAENENLCLADRLMNALKAGFKVGGEEDDEKSAGIIVCDRYQWPIVDLRVDWDAEPIAKLNAIWQQYKPQLNDYILRAVDPTKAPDF